jgi:hypothetical protein
MVTLASSTDRNFKKYLSSRESVDGYAISNIDWSDRVGATKVTITKDGQYATLTFNQALLSQPIANTVAVQPGVQPPNQPPQPVNQPGVQPGGVAPPPAYLKPAPIPSLPPQQPVPQPAIVPNPGVQNRVRSRGLIQRSPQTNAVTPTPAPDSDD